MSFSYPHNQEKTKQRGEFVSDSPSAIQLEHASSYAILSPSLQCLWYPQRHVVLIKVRPKAVFLNSSIMSTLETDFLFSHPLEAVWKVLFSLRERFSRMSDL